MSSVQDIKHFSSGIIEPYIFISYSHDDSDIVEKLAKKLEEAGFCVWVDYENIRGQHFSDDIKNGIRECSVFLQCISKSYISKPYCEKEYKLADDENKGFVVAAIDEVRKEENPNAFPFGGNIYGYGIGIRNDFEGCWKSICESALLVRLKQGDQSESTTRYIFAGEQILTVLKNHCDNTYKQSGNYVLNEIHRELFADIIDESEQDIYKAEGAMEVSLLDFLKKEKNSKLVLLKGAGGTGKTVSMIQTCKKLLEEGICAVYIPLNKVKFNDTNDPVKEYIRKHIMGCDDSLFRVFESMANAEIQNNVYLFLDGANELPISHLNDLYEFIKAAGFSREWSGTRVILSSRTDLESVDIKILDMLPLEETKINDFLDKLGVNMPDSQKVLNLLKNPLMLGLYADAEKYSELYRKQGGRFKIKLESTPDTAAKIISNFMQTQLYQMASVSNNNNDFILYHVLIDYALPAVAARMLLEEHLLTETDLRSILKEVLDENDQHFRWYIDVVLEDLWWEYGVDSEYISRKDIKEIHDFAMKKYRFLYVNNSSEYIDEPAVEFLHQEFRDYFAGVYFANEVRMLEKGSKYISGNYEDALELGQIIIEKDSLEYCSDVLKESAACPYTGEEGYVFPGKDGRKPSVYSVTEKALNTLRHKEEAECSGISIVIANLMEILRFSRGNILAECDFSYLDLSRCKMNGCHFSEFYRDKIYSSVFDGSILNNTFLLNSGHTDNVCVVTEGINGWIYSADEDGWLLGWNYQRDEIVRIKQYQGLPKDMAYDLKTNRLGIAFEHQIILIDAISFKELFSRFNETDSKYFRYIKFDECGNVKYAYDLEPFRWFDLLSDIEEENCIQYPITSGCAHECVKVGKIIYSIYGKNIAVADLNGSKQKEILNHQQIRCIGRDIECINKASRINAISVSGNQSRFIVAIGKYALEYDLKDDLNDLKPLWTYSGTANIHDIKYMRNGGFVLAIGKKVVILDERGRVISKLNQQSVSDIVMFIPSSNADALTDSLEKKEKYYLVSREGVVKELDDQLNVKRIRKVLLASRFVWVSDRKTKEVQMLFGPNGVYPNGYRVSFETGVMIPSGWCFEMKTTRYNMYRREYVIKQGESAVVFDVRNESETYEYKNHTGIWIYGCSFYDIKGEMSSKDSQNFLRKNGGVVNGI